MTTNIMKRNIFFYMIITLFYFSILIFLFSPLYSPTSSGTVRRADIVVAAVGRAEMVKKVKSLNLKLSSKLFFNIFI